MRTISGSRYLAEALKGYGVTHIFHVPTVAVTAIAEMDELGIVGITAHGEKAAAYMADGYARVRKGPGICLCQNIGSTNLAAGLRDAYMAGSPVIAITGGTEPMSRGRGFYQEIEDFPTFEPLTKFNAYVEHVKRLPDLLRQAFRVATTGAPGPVHLQLQGALGSVLNESLDLDEAAQSFMAEPRFSQVPPFRPRPDLESVRKALEVIERAERPVIVAGGGVRWSGAGAQLAAFAEKAGIPVATSMTGKGVIDETSHLAVGVAGNYSRKSANQAVMRADLVLFIGSQAGSMVTDRWQFPRPGTTVVQIDIEPSQLGRNYPNAVSIQGDARLALEMLSAEYKQGRDRESWVAEASGYVAAWREEEQARLTSNARPTRPERLCREVMDFLPDDGVLVSDTGHSSIWTGRMIDIRPSQTFIRCAGSLGWALPASIGAKCAAGAKTVVCFTGDGGFYYHLQELETAVRHGINPIIVVNDNHALGQDMEIFEHSWGGRDEITDVGNKMWKFNDVDLAAVARALGAFAVRVEDPDDLQDALRQARASDRPAVVDVVTDVMALPAPPFGSRPYVFPPGRTGGAEKGAGGSR